jgi:serine phosphatase RsbU (regulator of sigma subunit)
MRFYSHTEGKGTATSAATGNGQPFQKAHHVAAFGVEVEAYGKPFGNAARGGDIHLVLHSKDAVRIAILDFPGHGVEVEKQSKVAEHALGIAYASMIADSHNLRAQMVEIDAQLRNALKPEEREELTFITATVAVIDFKNNLLAYVNSGNPRVIRFSAAQQKAYELEQTASTPLLMGPLEQVEGKDNRKLMVSDPLQMEDFTVNLVTDIAVGDIFIFCTDGFPEAIKHNSIEASPELLRLVEANAGKSANSIKDVIFRELINRPDKGMVDLINTPSEAVQLNGDGLVDAISRPATVQAEKGDDNTFVVVKVVRSK